MRSSEMFALETEKGPRHFYLYKHQVEMVSSGEIGKYRLTENHDVDDTYWAWWENVDEKFILCWPDEDLLEMCFAYGSKVSEDAGEGYKMKVSVERVDT